METNHDEYRAAREHLEERLNVLNHLVRAHDAREFRDRENRRYVSDLCRLNGAIDRVVADFETGGAS